MVIMKWNISTGKFALVENAKELKEQNFAKKLKVFPLNKIGLSSYPT